MKFFLQLKIRTDHEYMPWVYFVLKNRLISGAYFLGDLACYGGVCYILERIFAVYSSDTEDRTEHTVRVNASQGFNYPNYWQLGRFNIF